MGAPRHEGAWTDDRVGRLKKLWGEGWSAARIAGDLGLGVTRNAVIAKIHRLGLSNRPNAAAPTRLPPGRPARISAPAPTLPAPKAPAVKKKHESVKASTRLIAAGEAPAEGIRPPQDLRPDPVIGREPLRLDLMELGPGHCRWPLGKVAPFTFCGLRKFEESPYCREHHSIAHPAPTALSQKRDRQLIRSVGRFI